MFLLIDKPKGLTSHDVIDRLRKITGKRRIGHAGTLDPNATGLLIVAIGRESTRKLSQYLHFEKTYVAEAFLGETRDTDDAEGKVTRQDKSKNIFEEDEITEVLKDFEGRQMQTPPQYSAIKLHGKKAYDLARRGKLVKLSPRPITVYSIKLTKYNYPRLIFKTRVSGGTYVRALVRDIGKKLGCGAYLKNLRRTEIGQINVREAVSLDTLGTKNWIHYTSDSI